ncbi:metal ABC transporter ATP-binding protein [Salidesulfovibrio onnuriiensis]|uniref:metal ABC transporter ATP-binding protein n=1 Tax=Salidesulfovibrio onnuriiensis TaxID=2583823 RepID=UPI00202B1D60|nr:ABC transporter ATP-binding protein [Salidesulfovibrio onnuriiensis]
MSEFAVSLRNVSFAYEGAPVLEDVSMDVRHGDFMAILGPNGGGKSTLLKILLGLLAPQKGSVSVLGLAPGQAGGRIGYMPQYTHVSSSFPITVEQAVVMGLVKGGLAGVAGLRTGRAPAKKAETALDRVGMLAHRERRVSGLSGGQKQRVFIARALVSDPELLLLDEPTASVDQHHRNTLFSLLKELNDDMTIIMVSHDISTVATSVKSVACVNHSLHFHDAPVITGDMFKMAYGGDENSCPVELVTHGDIPHRVLEHHHLSDVKDEEE